MVIIVYGLINYEPLKYDDYVYPYWANVLGLMIAASSVLCIPIMAVYQFIIAPGANVGEKLKFIITPYSESHKCRSKSINPTSITINAQNLDSTCV